MTATIIPFRQRTVFDGTAAQDAGGFSQFHSASAYPDYFDFSNLQVSGAGSSPPVAWQTGRDQLVMRNDPGAFEDEWLALEMYDGEFPVDRGSLVIYSIMTIIFAAALGAVTGVLLA
jgi:hypothetical protein